MYLRYGVRIHTYIQTPLAFNTLMWDSLRLAPIKYYEAYMSVCQTRLAPYFDAKLVSEAIWEYIFPKKKKKKRFFFWGTMPPDPLLTHACTIWGEPQRWDPPPPLPHTHTPNKPTVGLQLYSVMIHIELIGSYLCTVVIHTAVGGQLYCVQIYIEFTASICVQLSFIQQWEANCIVWWYTLSSLYLFVYSCHSYSSGRPTVSCNDTHWVNW